MRTVIPLNDRWLFSKQENREAAVPVTLSHTWNVPANVTAEIRLPDGDSLPMKSSAHRFSREA